VFVQQQENASLYRQVARQNGDIKVLRTIHGDKEVQWEEEKNSHDAVIAVLIEVNFSVPVRYSEFRSVGV
jgi:hypothetical protein